MRILSIFLRLSLPLLFSCIYAFDCPLPECDDCVPAKVREAPGVGFELTLSYGTSSVHHYNGSKFDIAVIPASAPYRDLLQRLSQSLTVPRPSTFQRYLRRVNKRLGRPATNDVGILSALLGSLRDVTETILNQRLDQVVVTTPQFPGLTREDLQDAIDYVGLRSWLEYPLPYPAMLYSSNAAYAANRRGLCEEWDNIYACLEEAEDGDIPLEQVYAVTFTNTTLHTSVSRIDYAYKRTSDIHASAPELGLSHLESYPSTAAYWEAISTHLQLLPAEAAQRGRPITALTLLGENAAMPDFRLALKDALAWVENRSVESEFQGEGGSYRVLADSLKSHTKLVADPLWAPARGAAMYARVRQEVPWNCLEPKSCREGSKDVTFESGQAVLVEEHMDLRR